MRPTRSSGPSSHRSGKGTFVALRPLWGASVAVAVLALTACTSTPAPTPSRTVLDLHVTGSVGISMPADEGSRWLDAGNAIDSLLTTWGADVTLEFAPDDPATQAQQISDLVTAGVDILIVTPVDATALAVPLQEATAAGVQVIAYDRLIRDTPDVNYYVGFDTFGVGMQRAWAGLNGLGLTDLDGNPTGPVPEEPYGVEVFFGDITDRTYYYGYNGTWRQVLELSMEDGGIMVPSGQTAPEAVATADGDPQAAAARMSDLLTSVYTDGVPLNAVVASSDDMALAIAQTLRDAGRSPGSDDWPVIVGTGASLDAVRAVRSGELYATVLTDDRQLQEAGAYLAASILLDQQLDSLNVKDYDNGARTVPAFLVPGAIVTAQTLDALVIQSGYYTRDQVGG